MKCKQCGLYTSYPEDYLRVAELCRDCYAENREAPYDKVMKEANNDQIKELPVEEYNLIAVTQYPNIYRARLLDKVEKVGYTRSRIVKNSEGIGATLNEAIGDLVLRNKLSFDLASIEVVDNNTYKKLKGD